jgi:hypothetical protein
MPTFVLWVKPTMEGITEFSAPEGTCWTLDVRQGGGSEERKGVVIDPDNSDPVANTKDTTANFVMKFDKTDRQQAYLNVVHIKGVTRPFTADDTGLVPFIAFECRGLEPIAWYPNGPYCAKVEGGGKWEDVDLSDDWSEYCETAGGVSIDKEIGYEFRLHK